MPPRSLNLEEAGLPLLDAIYAAGADFSLWPQALIKLADAFGAQDAILGITGPYSLPLMNFAPRSDPAYMALYHERYGVMDDAWQRIMARSMGSMATDEMLSTPAQRSRSTIYNEWSRPQGYDHVLGGPLMAQQGWVTGLMVPRRRAFCDDSVRMLSWLSGHLARAVQLNIRLATNDLRLVASTQLLQSLPRAAFVLNANACLLMSNSAGEALLRPGGGLYLREGQVLVHDPRVQQRFASLVRESLNVHWLSPRYGQAEPMNTDAEILLPRPGQPPRRLLVAPLRHTDASRAAHIMPALASVLIIEADAPKPSIPALLQQRYGLTPAEARLALEMAQGDGKTAAAERLGISFSTARSHLSRIFDKTGVRRQAELVRLISQLHASQ